MNRESFRFGTSLLGVSGLGLLGCVVLRHGLTLALGDRMVYVGAKYCVTTAALLAATFVLLLGYKRGVAHAYPKRAGGVQDAGSTKDSGAQS